jgi:hypothetical protein
MGGYESIPSMNCFGFMEIDDHVDFSYLNYFVALYKGNHKTLHFSTIYVYIVMIVMDPLKPILNLCTLTMFHLHGEKCTCIHFKLHKTLLRPTTNI